MTEPIRALSVISGGLDSILAIRVLLEQGIDVEALSFVSAFSNPITEDACGRQAAKAAQMLSTAPGALHLRTLSTISDVSTDQSNTILFALPLEVLRAFEKVSGNNKPTA